MSKAIYLGAGTDIKPILLYHNIKEWILVDSQPVSEFGMLREKCFKRKYFLPRLLKIMKENEFKMLNNSETDKLIFKNSEKNQTLIYIINCAIPEEYDKIKNIIKGWDVLVDIGFHPNNIIMNEAHDTNELLFIGNYCTCYYYDTEADDSNDIINGIHENIYHFKSYDYITKNDNILNFLSLKELEGYH